MSNTPKTYEEYLTRTNENTVISGFGLDVATSECVVPRSMPTAMRR